MKPRTTAVGLTKKYKQTLLFLLAGMSPIGSHARGGSSGNPDGIWWILGLICLLGFFWLAKESPSTAWKIVGAVLAATVIYGWMK